MGVYLGTQDVNYFGGTPVINIRNQSKTVTPSGAIQLIQPDAGYTGLGSVTVEAMPLGTAGTPTASKGAVSNHAITVTPSVTNVAGYISGGTKTGTGVSVSASEVCSGSETKTANGTYDVTNLAQLIVNVAGSGKAVQVATSTSRATSSTYTKIVGDITVEKAGTYTIYWGSFRSSTSGTWGTQWYKNGTAQGTAQSTFSNHVQSVTLSNISLAVGDKVSVYARTRGSNYYAYVPLLVIIES